ncbi:MAG: AsmA-like C-terminal region-containing protein, partial [Muribaculaceae bacterium]|nr:AsmA-like C-terminal region-containing protein [Muribaculaceae bacterium]
LTPLLPLHNHFSHIDLRFNNDTVNISDISLGIGKSDIALSGLVTNVRRALTSKTDNNLKANLSLLSNTIDINQFAAGIFTGAAYADRKRKGKAHTMGSFDDADLERDLDALAKEDPGKSAPFLIPLNVNANLKIGAARVLYSDLILQNMGGDLLVYDGGVNLHDLRATSDAGRLTVSALYSAPKPEDMHFGFGLDLKDFNIGKFVKLVPAIDSITPLMHDFSGMINADIAATCSIDSGMNIVLPTLDAAIRITGDNLAFIDPKKYRTLGKWLGFKDKTDNTIHRMNVEMTVADGLMRVYPFAFNIDRYRLGIYGYNDLSMNFDYHISVLKSPLPFKFGITISGNPTKHKVRFGGAKFKEDTAIESVSVVNDARINLIDQIENVFKRGVRNSRFAKLQVALPAGYDSVADPGLSAADSLQLIREGLMDASLPGASSDLSTQKRDNSKDSSHGRKEKSGEEKKKRKRWLFF